MKITQVPSFQTSDGKLHALRSDALRHEAQIEVRAMIQSRALTNPTMTPAQVAEFIVSRADDVAEFLRGYREKMRRAAGAVKK